jgi:CHAD domain-containing protein
MKHLARLELERLESLSTLLAGADDVDEAVHRTRTGIKHLRAYLRLARRSIGTSTYRTENAALRDTARLLAAGRDAFVVIETARGLGADDVILAALAEEHARMMDGFERTTRTQVLDRIGAITTRWQYLMWQGPGAKSIGSGLERTYRKGLVEFETARSASAERAFHGWRRRVKYLRYQLEALDAPESAVRPFRLLGDELGHEHDQTVLIAVSSEHPGDAGYTDLARRSLLRRAELRSAALHLGGELFSHQPESFRHEVEAVAGLR